MNQISRHGVRRWSRRSDRLAMIRAIAERRMAGVQDPLTLARAVMEDVPQAIVITDAGGLIVAANPAAEALFGSGASALSGRSVGDLFPGVDVGAVRTAGSRDQVVRVAGGSPGSADVSLVSVIVRGRPTFVVVRQATGSPPEEPPTHDPLTGLANRGLFDESLVRAVFRGERSRSPVAVLSVDLDGFGNVNDAFGHRAGDGVLMEIGRRLEWAVRPGDLVARLGGDGFAVLCENLGSTSDAERIAARVVESVSKGVPVSSGVATITVSVGIAVASPGEDAGSLLERADRAMHEMRREGKAGYRVAGLRRG